MPQIVVEYTDNLNVDIQPLLARLTEEVVATGAISLKGVKSRAVKRTEYRIADGDPGYAFVHVGLLIREGRPVEVQKEATQRVMKALKETFISSPFYLSSPRNQPRSARTNRHVAARSDSTCCSSFRY
jgi:5-carboxymethyl-2-hydroxymuconate isomerase